MKILIAIPCHYEEKIIKNSLERLSDYLEAEIQGEAVIAVGENGSKDGTENIIKEINSKKILYFHTRPGKGRAVLDLWKNNQADVYVFMDADLSTGLKSLKPLVEAVASGSADISLGSRFHVESMVDRTTVRKIFSKCLHWLLVAAFNTKISDTTCGFKAVNKKIKDELLGRIENDQWFFDTELVILAEKGGYKIKEIPVQWCDERERRASNVRPLILGMNYLKEVLKLKKRC